MIFELLQEWQSEPAYTDFGIVAQTICHNPPGEGSRKLYYYRNTDLFQCYSNCGTFDVFELLQKVAHIQWNKEQQLNLDQQGKQHLMTVHHQMTGAPLMHMTALVILI